MDAFACTFYNGCICLLLLKWMHSLALLQWMHSLAHYKARLSAWSLGKNECSHPGWYFWRKHESKKERYFTPRFAALADAGQRRRCSGGLRGTGSDPSRGG